jgi:hypothetical protein
MTPAQLQVNGQETAPAGRTMRASRDICGLSPLLARRACVLRTRRLNCLIRPSLERAVRPCMKTAWSLREIRVMFVDSGLPKERKYR